MYCEIITASKLSSKKKNMKSEEIPWNSFALLFPNTLTQIMVTKQAIFLLLDIVKSNHSQGNTVMPILKRIKTSIANGTLIWEL